MAVSRKFRNAEANAVARNEEHALSIVANVISLDRRSGVNLVGATVTSCILNAGLIMALDQYLRTVHQSDFSDIAFAEGLYLPIFAPLLCSIEFAAIRRMEGRRPWPIMPLSIVTAVFTSPLAFLLNGLIFEFVLPPPIGTAVISCFAASASGLLARIRPKNKWNYVITPIVFFCAMVIAPIFIEVGLTWVYRLFDVNWPNGPSKI